MESKGIGGHQSATNKTDVWITDPAIIHALGPFDLDPCANVVQPWPCAKKQYTKEDNGLIQKWEGRVWVNPPYGGPKIITPWMHRTSEHGNGIALIFARTETKMFFKYAWRKGDSIFFFEDRLYFFNEYGIRAKANAGAPSCLIAYGDNNSQSISDSSLKGKHIPLTYSPVIVVGISGSWFEIVSIAVKSYGDSDLTKVYDMVERIAPDKVERNKHWKEKIRQKVYEIRKTNLKNVA